MTLSLLSITFLGNKSCTYFSKGEIDKNRRCNEIIRQTKWFDYTANKKLFEMANELLAFNSFQQDENSLI